MDSDKRHSQVVTTAMLIRRSPREVYQAFVDPAITTQFWFTRSSGPVEPNGRVEWSWEMYDVSAEVQVIALEPDRRIEIEWPGLNGPERVEWTFESDPAGTYVTIRVSAITGTLEEVISQACDNMQGFSFVLAGAKAWLEHGIRLELARDRVPTASGVS